MKHLSKKMLCMAFILATTLFTASAENKLSKIQQSGEIKIATNAEFEPFEYKDGDKIVGIDIDIAKKIAESLNAQAKINDVSFDAVTLELNSGNCDFAIAAMSYSSDKAQNVDFSDVYYYSKQAIIVPNNSNIKSSSDLDGKRIGVAMGFTGDIYCTENFKNAKIERYNKSSDAVLDLINNRLDAVVVDDAPAKKLISLSNNKVKMLDEYLFEEGYRIAVPKGETELLEHINSVLKYLKDSKEIDKIVDKYITDSYSPSIDLIAQIYNNLKEKDRYKMIINGLLTTLEITAVALLIGIFIGILISAVKVSHKENFVIKILKALADLYLTIIRGTPVVVQLFVMYYLIFSSTGLSKIFVAMIAFGVNSGAYVAEIIRSGILSIDVGQYEAGRSLGLSESITMRKIIMPQALKNVLPTLVNEFIQLIKETSVAGFIGVMDLSRAGDIIRSQTYEPLVPLSTVAILYLITVIATTFFMSFIERKLRVNDKR
ncbi:MAG: ABC transporter substrate-binding protein/permease [Clostridia bacterium]|nr:ABC transporter substrate-binding protein/permease [Clostridia bacterium]